MNGWKFIIYNEEKARLEVSNVPEYVLFRIAALSCVIIIILLSFYNFLQNNVSFSLLYINLCLGLISCVLFLMSSSKNIIVFDKSANIINIFWKGINFNKMNKKNIDLFGIDQITLENILDYGNTGKKTLYLLFSNENQSEALFSIEIKKNDYEKSLSLINSFINGDNIPPKEYIEK